MQKIEEFVLCESVSFPLTERNIAAVMTMFVIEFQTKRQTFLRWQDWTETERARMNVSECPSYLLLTPSFILRLVSMNDETCHNFPHVPTSHPKVDPYLSCFTNFEHCKFLWFPINQPDTRRFIFVFCLIWPKWASRSLVSSNKQSNISEFWANFDELELDVWFNCGTSRIA